MKWFTLHSRLFHYAFLVQSTQVKKVNQSHYRPGVAPEGSRKLRFPDFMTMAQNSGKVVSLTHRPPLLPGNAPDTHFH